MMVMSAFSSDVMSLGAVRGSSIEAERTVSLGRGVTVMSGWEGSRMGLEACAHQSTFEFGGLV